MIRQLRNLLTPKTKAPLTTEKTKNPQTNAITSHSIIKGIVLYGIIAMSLFHMFFASRSDAQLAHKATYKPLIESRNAAQQQLLCALIDNEINQATYIEQLQQSTLYYQQALKTYHSTKYTLAHAHAFNGRSSFKYWFWVFGLSVSFFVLAIRHSYISWQWADNKPLKWYKLLECVAWMAISCFWVCHTVFLTTKDFNNTTYIVTGLLLSILIAIAVLF